MLRKLAKFIADRLVAWCEKNDRVYYITGGVNGKTVYLVRYIVFKSKYGCIYIHRFLRSDADDPHDHPWNFFTYILDGEYTEIFYDQKRPVIVHSNKDDSPSFLTLWTDKENRRVPGSLAYRRATDTHKVVVDKQLQLEYDPNVKPSKADKEIISKAPYTICFMGKRRREWGFWNKTGTTFTDWREYLNIVPGDPRIEGGE